MNQESAALSDLRWIVFLSIIFVAGVVAQWWRKRGK